MATYIVVIGTDVPDILGTVSKIFPGAMRWGPSACVITSDELSAQAVVTKITDATGLKKSLFVCRLTADYYGYSKSEFWNWIAASFADSKNG